MMHCVLGAGGCAEGAGGCIECARGMRKVQEVALMLEVFEVRELREVMRCVLLRTLEAVEGRLCLLEGSGGAGGDALCATFHARGCGGWALFFSRCSSYASCGRYGR